MADSLASQIITAIGGPENVRSLTHCATRLRFELADASKVDQNALEHMKGVLGAVPQSGDRFQVVIGGGVATVYENIMHLPEMANAGAASASGEGQKSNADVKAEARSKARGKVAWLDSFFEYLADSFRPILGVLLGASIIIALVNLLISLNVIPNDEASAGWVFIKAIWKGVFYFLPIMVAYNAAKKLKVDPWLGGAIMAILMTPQFTSLMDAKTTNDDEMWNKAENALRDVMNSLGIEYTEEIGEAAFYGPKLDVNVKPAVGNEITLSTCQLDFCLPAKFNLSYVDKDGEKKTPVVLHRAILGSLDRFMAYILEETKGNLPTWLAPVQVRVMPVKTDNDEIMNYAHEIVDALEAKNVRVELDDRAEKLGYRMREGQIQKVPYLLVIGFNEQENKTVSYRLHGQQDTTTLGLDEFVEKIDTEIKNKAR